MSYAIAPTFEGNRMGVRRLRTLSGLRGGVGGVLQGLGDAAADQYAALLVQGGVDPALVSMLQLNGASAAQLAAVYDGSLDATSLLNQLTGTQGPSNPASAQNPISNATVSTAFGIYDLTQEASWSTISSLFNSVGQQLQIIAKARPSDSDVISNVSQFNSLVTQWSGYYQQAFGSAPASVPQVTLGIIPVAIVAIVAAGIVALLASLYGIYQWAQTKQAQITSGAQVQTTAVTGAQAAANSLLQQAQAVQATNPTLSAQLRAQAAGLIGQTVAATSPQPGTLTAWFTTNWQWVLGGFAAVAIGIPLIQTLGGRR